MWQVKLSCCYWQKRLGWLLSAALAIAVTVGLSFGVSQLLLVTKATYENIVLRPLGTAEAQLIAKGDEGMFGAWQTVLARLPELKSVTPVLSRQTVAIYNGIKTSVQVRGIEAKTYFLFHPVQVEKGRQLASFDKSSVMISSVLADELRVSVGQTLELVTPYGFRSYEVIGITDEASSVVSAPLSDIQTLFTSGEYVDGFEVQFASMISQERALNVLQERFQTVAAVMTPAERVQPVRQVLLIVRVVLIVLLMLSLVLLLCLLLNVLATMKTQRHGEAELLYTLGISRQHLARWRSLELNLVFALATVVGLAVAVIVARFQRVEFYAFSFGLAALIGLSVVAAVWMFWVYASENVVRSETKWGRILPTRAWLSWQLLLQLGRQYWLSIVVVTVALTVFTSVDIILRVQRSSLEALVATLTKEPVLSERQFQVREEVPIEGELSRTMRWNMAMMPGVAFVSSHLTKVLMEDKLEENLYVLDFASFPYQSYFQTTEGVDSSALAQTLRAGRRLAVSESLAESYSLKTGMSLRLRTATGQHHYKVVAILKDIGGVSRAMFIDRRTYLRDWGRAGDGLFLLSLEETWQPEQVAGLLQEQLSQRYAGQSYNGLPWRALSLKSEFEQLVARLLLWCRWLMILFVILAVMLLSHALSRPPVRELVATFYLLGGQPRLLAQLSRNAVVVTTTLIVMTAFSLGTSLSYWLVTGLQQSGSYWVWHLSAPSYGLSLLVVVGIVVVLFRVMFKNVVALSHPSG
jgi:ABC-type lipoprotein release transport system permease subunit